MSTAKVEEVESYSPFTANGVKAWLKSIENLTNAELISYYKKEHICDLSTKHDIKAEEIEHENAYFHVLAERGRKILREKEKTNKISTDDQAFMTKTMEIILAHMDRFITKMAGNISKKVKDFEYDDARQEAFIEISQSFYTYNGLKGRLINHCQNIAMKFFDRKTAELNHTTTYYNTIRTRVKKVITQLNERGIEKPMVATIKKEMDKQYPNSAASEITIKKVLNMLEEGPTVSFNELMDSNNSCTDYKTTNEYDNPEAQANIKVLNDIVIKALDEGCSDAQIIAYILANKLDLDLFGKRLNQQISAFSRALNSEEIGYTRVFVDMAEREHMQVVYDEMDIDLAKFKDYEAELFYTNKHIRKKDVDKLLVDANMFLSNTPEICEYAGVSVKYYGRPLHPLKISKWCNFDLY